METLQGKVAVVTGGASGIGLAMARRFRAEGMTVVIADVELPGIAPYAASKHAVVSLGETLAAELGSAGVGVVCPGMVATGITVSDRNCPDHLRDEVHPVTASSLPSLEAMERSDPALVADTVADAVRTGRLWLLTHPEVIELVEQRHRGLTDAARSAS